MICPKCGTAAIIAASRTAAEGDDSPDTETKVFVVQEFRCRNSACSEHGKAVGEARHRIY